MESIIASVLDPLLRDACRIWAALRPAATEVPPPSLLDALSFRPLIGRMSVVEVLRASNGLRFKYRLQGTAVTLGNGPMHGEWAQDWTGRFLDSVPLLEFAAEAAGNFGAAATRRSPVPRTITGFRDGLRLSYEVVVLPFGSAGSVERLLVVNMPLPPPPYEELGDNPTSLDFYHARLLADMAKQNAAVSARHGEIAE
jgi:hypothetical protein